jgi:hypothetical protein
MTDAVAAVYKLYRYADTSSSRCVAPSLANSARKWLGYTQYDLAQTRKRTCLLAEAWQKAEDKRLHLDRRNKAVAPTRKMKKRLMGW